MILSESIYQPIDGVAEILVARNPKNSSTAFSLRDGSICIYSPLPKLKKTELESLVANLDVSFFIAPNHYHHKGLHDHVELFKDATVVCSANAKPRLEKQTALKFQPLDQLASAIPSSIEIIEPQGLKTGEVWLRISLNDEVILVVTDAFCAPDAPQGEFANRPDILKPFPKFGIGDANLFKTSALEIIDERPPTILIPCHGAPVKNKSLADDLKALLEKRI